MNLDEWYESRRLLREAMDARATALDFLWSIAKDFLKGQRLDPVTREKPFDIRPVEDNGELVSLIFLYEIHFTTVGSRDETASLPVIPYFNTGKGIVQHVMLRAGGYFTVELPNDETIQISPSRFIHLVFEELVDRPELQSVSDT